MQAAPINKIALRVKRTDSGDAATLVDVSRVTPLGVTFRPQESNRIDLGDIVEATVVSEGEESVFRSVAVGATEGGSLVTRFLTTSFDEQAPDRRTSQRWNCPVDFLPVAVAPAPGRFNEFLSFRVRNVSRDGLELQTEIEGSFLVRGMLLRLNLSLPMIGDTVLTVKILRIQGSSIGGREVLSIGTEIVETEKTSLDLVGSYLNQFSNIDGARQFSNPDQRRSKFMNVQYDFAKTEEDFRELIELSKTNVGDIDATLSSIDARLIVGRLDSKIVSVAAVEYPDNDGFGLADRPRPDEAISVSSIFCLAKPEHLVINGMFRFVASACVTCQRPYLITEDTERFKTTIQDMGFVAQKEGSNTKVAHPTEVLLGGRCGPVLWNLIWESSAEYIVQHTSSTFSGLTLRLLKIYRSMRILSKAHFAIVKLIVKIRPIDLGDHLHNDHS